MDIKQKDLQIGMLEVVENKGANLRLKGALMGLIEVEERFRRGLIKLNTRYGSTVSTDMSSNNFLGLATGRRELAIQLLQRAFVPDGTRESYTRSQFSRGVATVSPAFRH